MESVLSLRSSALTRFRYSLSHDVRKTPEMKEA
jgi:hypothetical protein